MVLEATGGRAEPPGTGLPAFLQINDEILTARELQDLVRRLPPPLRAGLDTESGRRQAMDGIVDWVLLRAESRRSGVEREPEVHARIAAARERIVVEAYVERAVRGSVVVGDAELEAHYATHRDQFKTSEAIRLSQILVRSADEARDILRDLHAGAEFSRLARERSLDPSRDRGGQLGWLERKVMDPDLAAAAFSLARSELSDVVHTRLGFHVIRVDDTRPVQYAPYPAVKEGIRETIRRQRARDLLRRQLETLRRQARVTFTEAALQALGVEGEDTPAPP
jgi:parvulin-like peptidyl-prolyl isomerase